MPGRTRWIDLIADAGYAVVAVLLFATFLLPVPLYVPYSCLDCPANVPRIPLVPFVAAFVLVLLRPARRPLVLREIARDGLVLGMVGAAYIGLARAAALPFGDPYVTLPYRVYAVVFLAGATAIAVVLAATLTRSDDPGNRALGSRTGLVIAAATIWAAVTAPATIPLAMVAGGMVGVVGERTGAARAVARRIGSAHLLGAAVLVAVLFRLLFGLQTLARTGPGLPFAYASDDGNAYYEKAVGLMADPSTIREVLTAADGYPPLYSVFLWAIFALTGESLVAVIAAQAILAGAAAFFLYLLARRIGGPAVAAVAAFLYAADQNMIQNNSTLTTEALFIPVLIGSLLALAIYGQRRGLGWLIAAALGLALVFVTRNMLALAVLAAVAWLWWLRPRDPLRTLRDAAILVAAMFAAASPVAIATAASEGRPRFTNQLADVGFAYLERSGHTVENGFLLERGIDPFRDPGGALARIAQDPLPVLGFYAVAVPHRLSYLLFSINPGSSDPVTITNAATYPNRFGQLWQVLFVVAVAVAAVATVRTRAWRAHPEIVLLVVFLALYLALFSFVFPPRQAFRYRLPIMPVLMIAQAVGLSLLARWAVHRPDRLR